MHALIIQLSTVRNIVRKWKTAGSCQSSMRWMSQQHLPHGLAMNCSEKYERRITPQTLQASLSVLNVKKKNKLSQCKLEENWTSSVCFKVLQRERLLCLNKMTEVHKATRRLEQCSDRWDQRGASGFNGPNHVWRHFSRNTSHPLHGGTRGTIWDEHLKVF